MSVDLGHRVAKTPRLGIVRHDHKRHDLALEGAVASVLTAGEDRVLHFVLVIDPSRRTDKKTNETPDPTADARKARPTEEEKRVIDRRNGGAPVPVPAGPPTPPTQR